MKNTTQDQVVEEEVPENIIWDWLESNKERLPMNFRSWEIIVTEFPDQMDQSESSEKEEELNHPRFYKPISRIFSI